MTYTKKGVRNITIQPIGSSSFSCATKLESFLIQRCSMHQEFYTLLTCGHQSGSGTSRITQELIKQEEILPSTSIYYKLSCAY